MKRVICGPDQRGNVVLYEGPLRRLGFDDEKMTAASEGSREAIYLAWAAPDSENRTEDYAAQVKDFNLQLKPGETRFVRVEIAPGAKSLPHRTPQINDYLIALSGELTMHLEDGSSTKLAPGDMLVQLAGWHWWENEGTEPFVMAGVVVGIETDEIYPFGVQMAESH